MLTLTWLTGCVLPPALTIVSIAADGLSLISSGKSVSDHALSAVIDRDCAVYRFAKGAEICRETVSDRRRRTIVVALSQSTHFEDVDQTGEEFYMLDHRHDVLIASVGELISMRILFEGFPRITEFFGLVQDDGALEVFSHDPSLAKERSNLRLIVKILGYAANPSEFEGFRFHGSNYRVEDILV
jgi:hypothetical protein